MRVHDAFICGDDVIGYAISFQLYGDFLLTRGEIIVAFGRVLCGLFVYLC